VPDPIEQERARVHVNTVPVSVKSKKVYTFADDCNLLLSSCRQTIDKVIYVLQQFATLSGLECNIEKSNYLNIGTGIERDDFGAEIGLVKK
jgi:hypothetical protein